MKNKHRLLLLMLLIIWPGVVTYGQVYQLTDSTFSTSFEGSAHSDANISWYFSGSTAGTGLSQSNGALTATLGNDKPWVQLNLEFANPIDLTNNAELMFKAVSQKSYKLYASITSGSDSTFRQDSVVITTNFNTYLVDFSNSGIDLSEVTKIRFWNAGEDLWGGWFQLQELTLGVPVSKFNLNVTDNVGGFADIDLFPVANDNMYASGQIVTITSNHDPNALVFNGWSGGISGTENPKTFTVWSNMNIYANYTETDIVVDPVISVPGGEYLSAVPVRLYNGTPGATIYYTTNGTNPTPTNGSAVSDGDLIYIDVPSIQNSGSVELKVMAYEAGKPSPSSNIISETYIIRHSAPLASDPARVKRYTGPYGTTLVTAEGKLLRGVAQEVQGRHLNQAYFMYDPNYYQQLLDSGFNYIRLKVWDPYINGVQAPGWRAVDFTNINQIQPLLDSINSIIDLCSQFGIHVSFTGYNDVGKYTGEYGNPNASTKGYIKEVWSILAPFLKDRTHVMYEWANEPLSLDAPEEALLDMGEIYDLLRYKAPETEILLFGVATVEQISNENTLVDLVDEFTALRPDIDWNDKTSVSFHPYTNFSTESSRPLHEVMKKYPVICTEGHFPKVDLRPSGLCNSEPQFAAMDNELWIYETLSRMHVSWAAHDMGGSKFDCNFPFLKADAVVKGYEWDLQYCNNQHQITFNSVGNGKVSIAAGAADNLLVDPFTYQVCDGQKVLIVAEPENVDYIFDHWSGSLSGNDPRVLITSDSDLDFTAHFVENPFVDPPVFSPSSGAKFIETGTLNISTGSSNSEIRYTLDGSNPTHDTGILYEGPISIPQNVTEFTVKAVAYRTFDPAGTVTEVQQANYRITSKLEFVKASIAPVIDGTIDQVWQESAIYYLNEKISGVELIDNEADLSGLAKVLWDNAGLYLLVEVKDDIHRDNSDQVWHDDGVEFFLDIGNHKNEIYSTEDRQFGFRASGNGFGEHKNKAIDGINYASNLFSGGYNLEAFIPWSNLNITNPTEGLLMGTDIHVLDDDDEDENLRRDSKRSHFTIEDNAFIKPSVLTTAVLVNQLSCTVPETPQISSIVPGNGSVSISWNSVPNADEYIIYYGNNSGGPYANLTFVNSGSVTTEVIDQLALGYTYYFVIAAKDGNCESTISDEVDIVLGTPGSSTLTPVHDTWVFSAPWADDTNYNHQDDLLLSNDQREAYLKFDLSSMQSSGVINSAKIRLFVNNWNSGAQHVFRVVNDNNWEESTLTWNNRPTDFGADIASHTTSQRVWNEVVLNSEGVQALQNALGGEFTINIRQTSGNLTSYSTKEDLNYIPELIIDGFNLQNNSTGGRKISKSSISNEEVKEVYSGVKLYPNPSKEIIWLESEEKIFHVQIFSLSGNLIKEIKPGANEVSIDVKDIPKSVYILKISTGLNTQTLKFLKD